MTHADETTVSDAELHALFRPRRADPTAFRARVDAKAREREAERRDAEPERPTWRSELTRRVAAVIPLDPTGAATGAKLVSATFVLPFLVLAAIVGAFSAGLRSVRRSSAEAVPVRAEPAWTQRHASFRRLASASWLMVALHVTGAVVLLAPIVTGWSWTVDLQIAMFLLAGVALVVTVRGLAESALLTPRIASSHATAILGALFCGTYLWSAQLGISDPGSDLGTGWAACVVLAGLVACPLLTRRAPGLGAWAWVGWVFVVVLLNPIGVTRSSPASLREQLAHTALDAADLSGWEGAAHVHEALALVGAAPADLRDVEAQVERGLADPALDVQPQVWTTAHRMGLMTPERWERLAARGNHRYRIDQLLKPSGSTPFATYDEYLVPLLLATRDVAPEQRADLARRVDARWPAEGQHGALERALLCVRMLDELGDAARVEARRDDARGLLVSHWVGERRTRFARVGGFTSSPAKFATSFADSTYAGVALMARFGVPPGIEVRAVRSFLRDDSRATPLVGEWMPELRATQRAALLRLEREVGMPPRSLLASVVAERQLIAAILLVALCCAAVLSAPRVGSNELEGALP